jgi:hypothetical protein
MGSTTLLRGREVVLREAALALECAYDWIRAWLRQVGRMRGRESTHAIRQPWRSPHCEHLSDLAMSRVQAPTPHVFSMSAQRIRTVRRLPGSSQRTFESVGDGAGYTTQTGVDRCAAA